MFKMLRIIQKGPNYPIYSWSFVISLTAFAWFGWYWSKLAAATSGAQVFPSKSPILNDSLEIEFIRKSKINRWAVPRWWKYLKHFTFTMRKHATTLWASQIGISRFVFSMNSQWIHWKWVLDGLEWRSVVAAPDVGPHQWILRFRLQFFLQRSLFCTEISNFQWNTIKIHW